MLNGRRVRQPQYFDRFRCLAADCEDTCCVGWDIVVDRNTFDKYRDRPEDRIGGRALSQLIAINQTGSDSRNYAKFQLENAACPALHHGSCSIQQNFGEPHIPDLCSTFPRHLQEVGGFVERSLRLSCPEAARLVLTDPGAMVFQERIEEELPHRPGSIATVAGDDGLHQVRGLAIEVIRERSLPLWQRIASLSFVADRLAGLETACAVAVMREHLGELRQGKLTDALEKQKGNPSCRLETVLELIVARIGSDYTAPRFQECYRDFMSGLEWTGDSTMDDLVARYSVVSSRYVEPFLRGREYMLENFLINYLFRTLFPYGRRLPDLTLSLDSSRESIERAILVLSIHYAIMRTLLIGTAGLYKESLHPDHVVKLFQSWSKAFLHSDTFEDSAVICVRAKIENPTDRIVMLLRD